MRILTSTSVVSVVCATAVWLCVIPQLVGNGVVELDDIFVLVVVVVAPVGLISSSVGAIAGAAGLVRRRLSFAGALMAAGQGLTVALGIGIVVWATNFATTGWELLLLPVSLMLGQVPVAAGLVVGWVRRRRARTESGTATA